MLCQTWREKCNTEKVDCTLSALPKVTTGDRWKNWQEFHEEWEDYKVATSMAEKSDAVQVATLLTNMGNKAVGIMKRLNLTADD